MAVLGLLGGSSFIVAKQPDAEEVIDQIAPYQGWIGAISALSGVSLLVMQLLSMGNMADWPLRWWTQTANAAVMLALGLLLGVGILKQFSSSEEANAKIDEMVETLSPYQVTLGLVALGLSVWTIVKWLVL